jgi:hypothetical protein
MRHKNKHLGCISSSSSNRVVASISEKKMKNTIVTSSGHQLSYGCSEEASTSRAATSWTPSLSLSLILLPLPLGVTVKSYDLLTLVWTD